MTDHAIFNAKAHADSISEGIEALRILQEGEAERVEYDGEAFTDENRLREQMQESALSVEIRTEWHCPGDQADGIDPGEYRIVLTAGGPACRIVGDLSAFCNPSNATIQWQDWGTPWTGVDLCDEGDINLDKHDRREAAILEFAQLFYFGE